MTNHPHVEVIDSQDNLSTDEINFLNQIDTDIAKRSDNISGTENISNQLYSTDEDIIAEILVREPPLKKQKLNCTTFIKYDLKEIVSSHPIGNALLKISEVKQKFTTLHQSYLVELIVIHFYKIGM